MPHDESVGVPHQESLPAVPCPPPKVVTDVQDIKEIGTRLRAAAELPDLLEASFDAFEIIRQRARSSDQLAPELFAAFMMTADAAVDGREAVTSSPALAAGGSPAHAGMPAAITTVDQIAADLAALGALLSDLLTQAAASTAAPEDKDACTEAADAARRIRDLMAVGEDDRGLR
jgi:hypothetical protein